MIRIPKIRQTPLESDVEGYLRRKIKERGGKAYKFNSAGQRSVPDRIIVWPGGVVHFIEVKTIGGKLSTGQRKEIKFLRSLGQLVWVIWTKAGVDEYLRKV